MYSNVIRAINHSMMSKHFKETEVEKLKCRGAMNCNFK